MRIRLLGPGVLALSLLVVQADAADARKDKKAPAADAKNRIDANKLRPTTITGTVKTTPDGGTLILTVESQHLEYTNRNTPARPGKKNRARPPQVKVVTDRKEIEAHLADTVKVRFKEPPRVFDDKGNPKKYTADELKALKGKDATLPGYDASLEALKAGHVVQAKLEQSRVKDAANKMEVTFVLIVGEVDPSARKGKADK